MAPSVVGIDIGSTSLRAVEVANADKPRPTVLRMHEVPLPVGSASRGEVVEPNTVAQALRQLWKQGGFASKKVVLGIGNQRLLARDFTVPKMPMARIRESLPFQAQELLPVPVADALLDFYPVAEAESEHGTVINGLLIAAVKEAVTGNIKAVTGAGLSTVDVDAIPFALSRALVTRQGMPGTLALVEVGASTTNVVVLKDSVPQFVRIIPTGGDDITRAIETDMEITAAEAEGYKRSLGLATHVANTEEHQAAEAIFRVTNDLLLSLRNTVNYYVNTRPDEKVDLIVLSGGGAQLPGFAKALGEVTRIAVAAGDPFAGIRLAKALAVDAQHQSYAVALGLALGAAA
jgi:type IV pilus assembly protein PilM